MILQRGDKILVAHRKLFPQDQPRFFTGRVEEYEQGLAVVSGHSWVRDVVTGQLLRKPDRRTKIIALASGTLLVYRLLAEADLEQLRIVSGKEGEVFLSDGKVLEMDISERIHPQK